MAKRPQLRLLAVGSRLSSEALLTALGEEFSGQVDVTLERRARFDANEFLSGAGQGLSGMDVWVDASDPERARLYFVDRADGRYAMSSLELSGKMDELDLEALAQVISWSSKAFRSSETHTLDRAEAEAELKERESQPESAVTEPKRMAEPKQARVTLSTRLFYRGTWHSRELGLVHGPGLGLHLHEAHGPWVWGGYISGQIQLPRAYEDERLSVQVTALAPRVGARLTASTATRVRLGGVLGTGADVVWTVPGSGESARYTPRNRAVHAVPLMEAGLVAEVDATNWLVVEITVAAEFDMHRVRYEVLDDGVKSSVISRSLVRPTLLLGAQFH